MTRKTYGPLTAAARALQAAGYDLCAHSDEDRLILSVSDGDDDDGDATLAEIRALVEPLGCTAEWTGDSNTDADGYTTSDVRIEVVGSAATSMHTITDEQIATLRAEAGAAGDMAQVAICDRALRGSAAARAECARVIAAARVAAGD